jgi:hypothetical protein
MPTTKSSKLKKIPHTTIEEQNKELDEVEDICQEEDAVMTKRFQVAENLTDEELKYVARKRNLSVEQSIQKENWLVKVLKNGNVQATIVAALLAIIGFFCNKYFVNVIDYNIDKSDYALTKNKIDILSKDFDELKVERIKTWDVHTKESDSKFNELENRIIQIESQHKFESLHNEGQNHGQTTSTQH